VRLYAFLNSISTSPFNPKLPFYPGFLKGGGGQGLSVCEDWVLLWRPWALATSGYRLRMLTRWRSDLSFQFSSKLFLTSGFLGFSFHYHRESWKYCTSISLHTSYLRFLLACAHRMCVHFCPQYWPLVSISVSSGCAVCGVRCAVCARRSRSVKYSQFSSR